MYIDSVFEEGSQSYLIHGDKDVVYSVLLAHTHAKKFSIMPFLYDRLAIDDVRRIKTEASLLESTDTSRILFIGATDIGIEAEQALLKLLEEPPRGATILLVTNKTTLLPTILSRVVDLGAHDTLQTKSALLPLNVVDRLAYILKLTKDSDDSEVSRKAILSELKALIDVARTEARAGDTKYQSLLSDLLDISIAIEARGAPTKMLLEHLAITL